MDPRTLLFIILALARYSSTYAAAICSPAMSEPQPRIGLLISPIVSITTINEIVIYWSDLDYQPRDILVLYKETLGGGLKPIHSVAVESSSGSEATGIRAEFIPSSNLTFEKQCLQYHVGWLRDGVVRKKNCIKTEPNWMHDRKDYLGSLTMSKVFLPGTHNAAIYAIRERPGIENFIQKYAVTQDVDILSQLIYGARYLDIRVGYYPKKKELWFTNHGIYRSVPLRTVVEQVKTFLDNTQELVIFDLKEFPIGFKNISVHREFATHLKEEFAEYLLPKNFGWSTTLRTMWMSGRRLIIGYDHTQIVAEFDHLWPRVNQQWGNVRTIEDLFDYLNRIETSARGVNRLMPRSAMAELTATATDVILNRLGGLRQMAENVNLNVTNWYSTLWQDTANIVSVDFLRGTGIVDTAIEANDRRNCVAN